MMGWPDGWATDAIEPRTHSLKLIGNGVVPQQAYAALSMLLAPPVDPMADSMFGES